MEGGRACVGVGEAVVVLRIVFCLERVGGGRLESEKRGDARWKTESCAAVGGFVTSLNNLFTFNPFVCFYSLLSSQVLATTRYRSDVVVSLLFPSCAPFEFASPG